MSASSTLSESLNDLRMEHTTISSSSSSPARSSSSTGRFRL
uniref:Uncharacterized protein n=1 Tax=Arundo donax TaxID=35708 RepID=A0A0A9G4A2_ARUDO